MTPTTLLKISATANLLFSSADALKAGTPSHADIEFSVDLDGEVHRRAIPISIPPDLYGEPQFVSGVIVKDDRSKLLAIMGSDEWQKEMRLVVHQSGPVNMALRLGIESFLSVDVQSHLNHTEVYATVEYKDTTVVL